MTLLAIRSSALIDSTERNLLNGHGPAGFGPTSRGLAVEKVEKELIRFGNGIPFAADRTK